MRRPMVHHWLRLVARHKISHWWKIGQCFKAHCGCHRQSAKSAGLDMLNRWRQTDEHHLYLSAKQIGHRRRRAAIGLEREAGPAQKISAISKRCKNVPAPVSCLCPGEMLRPVIVGAGCCCAGPVGMMATNDAIIRASSRSFLARRPLALANCRSLNGLIWRTDMPAASKARTTPRS